MGVFLKKTDYFVLVFFLLISFAAGAAGSFFTFSEIPTWYAALIKPSFNPPNWVFGPVWTVLYFLMGISAFLAWKNGKGFRATTLALTLFFTQLVLNSLWSYVFFGMKELYYALVVIMLLWITILGTIVVFAKVYRRSAYLLAPYILWVSFAGILNYFVYKLNP